MPPLAAWMIRTGPLRAAATGCTYRAPSDLTSLSKDRFGVDVCQEKILKDIQENEGYEKLNARYRSLLQLTLNFYSSAMSQAGPKWLSRVCCRFRVSFLTAPDLDRWPLCRHRSKKRSKGRIRKERTGGLSRSHLRCLTHVTCLTSEIR